MLRIRIILGLEQIWLPGLPPEGMALSNKTRIGNDRGALRQLFDQESVAVFGTSTLSHALDSYGAYLWSNLEYPDHDILKPEEAVAYVRILSARGQMLSLAFWLVKDSCVTAQDAYLRADYPTGPGYLEDHFSLMHFKADCNREITLFDEHEYNAAIAFANQFDDVIPKAVPTPGITAKVGAANASRIARCLYFVDAARSSSDIAVRIAFYCVCLEALFSTDPAGVSHRVAERVAVFLGSTGQERKGLYRDIHDLYDMRSTLVHGGSFSAKLLKRLVPLSAKGDSYLRACIRKILGDPSLLAQFSSDNTKAVRAYFLDAIFPDDPA